MQQHDDRAVLEHGIETGIVKRLPHGEFIEVHQPLAGVDAHGHPIELEYQGAPVPKKLNQLGYAGNPAAGSLLRPDRQDETARLDRAHRDVVAEEDDEHRRRRELAGRPDAGRPAGPRP